MTERTWPPVSSDGVGRSLIGPLGHYIRDSGEHERPSDRMMSLLAFHRVVAGAALEGRLWGPRAEVRRAIVLRLRSAQRAGSSDTVSRILRRR